MTIHWDALFAVFAVSLGSAVGVVALVTVALLGLSARATQAAAPDVADRRPALSPAAGTAVAAVCLTAAAAIVLFGLWVLVVR
jgi:predicted secreted protein